MDHEQKHYDHETRAVKRERWRLFNRDAWVKKKKEKKKEKKYIYVNMIK